ncbi:MAG: DoxX family membrane protein [Acidimicrobiia bacterium]|nr:DoxX family membrane protein [Acidimicrobiia bacterium]MDH4309021.1 DoxX family membrane protein [Acidimicrobiia bacterium]
MLFESMLAIGALLLITSGGAKLVDPEPTRGALRSAGLPSARPWVTVLALAEVVAGAFVLVSDWALPRMAVSALYLGFAAFAGWALVRDLPVQSCGCFGRTDTPPSIGHVVITVTIAVSAGFAGSWQPPLASAGEPQSLAVLGFGAVGAYLCYLMMAELPALQRSVRR